MASFHVRIQEFAVSTGGNVNDAPGQSTFDHPPAASTDLLIDTPSGDPDIHMFSPGDRYRVSFRGHGGTTLAEARVIRRDFAGGGDDGVVVFEGKGHDGRLAQVVWTPNFDLETWYYTSFSNGRPPRFHTSGQRTASSHRHVCFTEGTRITTPRGQIPVERLRIGDRVVTLDNGAREILWIGRRRVPGTGPAAPVLFEPGAIGNERPLLVSQQHRMRRVSAHAHLWFGSSEVLVAACHLTDGASVRIQPLREVGYVHLCLATHELVFAEGAVAETLLLGQEPVVPEPVVQEPVGNTARHGPQPEPIPVGPRPMTAVRPILHHHEWLALAPYHRARTPRHPAPGANGQTQNPRPALAPSAPLSYCAPQTLRPLQGPACRSS